MIEAGGPLVTVAIPSYNHAEYIEECVRGVVGQSYQRIEVIIIDDGSSDKSAARLEALREECRARFVRFELRSRENRGLCNTLNEALAWAQGKYFAIIDSDDVLLPDNITTLVEQIEREPETNGVFGGAILIDGGGHRIGAVLPEERYYSFSDILARTKNMVSSCGLLRTEAMREAGGYVSGLYIEDWYMMLKLSETGARLKTIATPLVLYRTHPTNISKNVDKMLNARFQILDLFANLDGHTNRKALVHVGAAIEYWRMSKISSLHHLVSALKLDVGVAIRPPFWAAIFRIVVPTAITDLLKARKDRKRRRSAVA